MQNNTNERDLRKAYKKLVLRILLDEYTKLDVTKLLHDFEAMENINTLESKSPCSHENILIENTLHCQDKEKS